MPRLALSRFVCALVLALTLDLFVEAANWPQWRGPTGDSVSAETNLPVEWSEKKGIAWKCPLAEGSSTPAIWGDAVFITSQQDDAMMVHRIGKADGKIVWTHEVAKASMRRGNPKRREHTFHRLHNMASPSPVTDGSLVIFHFGNGDLLALDFAGKQLWQRNLQKDHGQYTIWWGHANSPVLWNDLVISVCMQDSLDDLEKQASTSYLVAHDKRTGEQKWKTLRMTGVKAEDCDSYTTPIFHKVGDREEMIIMGANQIDAYDPATGKQLWFLPGLKGSRTITGPTLAQEMVFATEGKKGALFALRLGGKGKLEPDAIAWKQAQATPDTPCPIVWKGLVFWVTDDGFASCHDAATGEQKWKERLGGDFKPSPLVADGKIYFLNLTGKCTVVAAAPTFQKLAENQLDDASPASLAVADGHIFLRGKKALYCIGK